MYLSTIIRPAAKLKNTRLQVEREELNVDVTTALIDGWRFPADFTLRGKGRLGAHCYLIVTITTERVTEGCVNVSRYNKNCLQQ